MRWDQHFQTVQPYNTPALVIHAGPSAPDCRRHEQPAVREGLRPHPAGDPQSPAGNIPGPTGLPAPRSGAWGRAPTSPGPSASSAQAPLPQPPPPNPTSLETQGLNPHPACRHTQETAPAKTSHPPGSHPHQSKLPGITHHADQQTIIRSLRNAGCYHLADRIARCGQVGIIALCRRCHRHEYILDHCDLIICPRCAARLSARRAAELRVWASTLPRTRHLVLTRRSTTQPLADLIRSTTKAFARLRRTKLGRQIRGGVWRLEVTHGAHGWHVHIHALIDSPYIPQPDLAAAWAKQINQDYAIVWIRDTSPDNYLAEVAKYVAKPAELSRLPPERLAELAEQLPRVRTWAQFGTLRKHHQESRKLAEGIQEPPRLCTCGASDWRYFDPNEWEWYCTLHGEPEPLPITTDTEPLDRGPP